MQNERFKKLLDEGIRSVASRQGLPVEAVEVEIGEITEYSRSSVQHWRRGNPPPDPKTLEQIVRYCLHNGRLNSIWAKGLLLHGGYPDPDQLLGDLVNKVGERKRIFMCYARGNEPDQSIALALAQELSKENDVFFDQATNISEWAEEVEAELVRCDFVVILLSEESSSSEVVLAEIGIAHSISVGKAKPRFLPIWVNRPFPLDTPLDDYLADVNWAIWQDTSDTVGLIQNLKAALTEGAFSSDVYITQSISSPTTKARRVVPPPTPSARRSQLETPEGTMDIESAFYIEREADHDAMERIPLRGETITIKGPRQIGKSSLLVRLIESARRFNKEVVFLDFQLFQSTYSNEDDFFRQFCIILSFQLGITDNTDQYWHLALANSLRGSMYVHEEILKKINRPILLAMDEVDSLFDTRFRNSFFSMLRTWHNYRARDAYWKNLDMALVTSTEPHYFVLDVPHSPFNVGTKIRLSNFTLEQVSDLNGRHKNPFSSDQLDRLMVLLNGHPYLVRKALYLIASKRISTEELFANATSDYGPFGDHLRSLLLRLHYNEELLKKLSLALKTGKCDDEAYYRIQGTGLIERKKGKVVPSCQLYADFFSKHLHHD